MCVEITDAPKLYRKYVKTWIFVAVTGQWPLGKNMRGSCYWNVPVSINISLTFVPKGQINNIPALVQIMAWRRPGDKPLSEPMMYSLLTHICVTRPQWGNGSKIFNSSGPSDASNSVSNNINVFVVNCALNFVLKVVDIFIGPRWMINTHF